MGIIDMDQGEFRFPVLDAIALANYVLVVSKTDTTIITPEGVEEKSYYCRLLKNRGPDYPKGEMYITKSEVDEVVRTETFNNFNKLRWVMPQYTEDMEWRITEENGSFIFLGGSNALMKEVDKLEVCRNALREG